MIAKLLGLLLAAATVAPALPPIVPADDTARFKGDGGAIKFDPTCRDYTLTTVTANPECAARLDRGETAPSLAIASHTSLAEPARRAEILAVLERTIAKENHPAAHYLLGSLLSNGERRPDYAKAAHHLAIASDRGNPAAADLLAGLAVAGKGTPRDIPRAIRLYERALAGGFLAGGWRLAQLYLDGRHMPKDEAYGRRLLEAVAAAGDERAAQLAPMLSIPVSNVQLLPAESDSAVRTKVYGLFDNPDIPPNFGNDDAFQRVHDAPFDDVATRTMLERDAERMPTPYLYELARRIAPSDPARALRTYLLARARMGYDAARCADWSALEAIGAWDRYIGPDIAFAIKESTPEMRMQAAREALRLEAALSGDQTPWWVCRSGMDAVQRALSGTPGPLGLKPASDWPKLRAEMRRTLESLADNPDL